MSKLNARAKSERATRETGQSKNGNIQFIKNSVTQLFELMVSTLYGKDSYYETANAKVQRARTAIDAVLKDHGIKGAEYIGRVIMFARTKMNIRTMPIVMAVELAAALHRNNLRWDGLRGVVAGVINRADELTDMFAYAEQVFNSNKQNGGKGKIPKAVLKGIGDAFNKFDLYQFGKYNNTSKDKTFKKVINVTHPTPLNKEQSEIFRRIVEDNIPVPYTWEVVKTQNGMLPQAERKSDAEVWTELVTKTGPGSMGYMALLRNLRNISNANVSNETLTHVANRISDPKEVARSKQLPWAFINAHKELEAVGAPSKLQFAVADAADLALGNLPTIGKNVWILLDCSGSMQHFSSYTMRARQKDDNSPIKIGSIFAAALFKAAKNAENVALTLFSDNAELVRLNPKDTVMTMYQKIMAKVYGGGTNLQAGLNQKASLGFEPDTVIVLSDMEVNGLTGNLWNRTPTNVAKLFDKDAVLVAVNLNSSETTPLDPRDGWIQLAGWSEAIFRFIDYTRRGDSIAMKLFNGELVD
jgi:hypothetical protein